MNIRSALDRLTTIQAAVSITDPATVSVLKAWKYAPPQKAALADVPAWINDWTLISEDRANSLRTQEYLVRSQLFVYDADLDRAADIATALFVAYVDDLDADVKLNNTVTRQSIRGGEPTLVVLEFGRRSYVGVDVLMSMTMREGATFS